MAERAVAAIAVPLAQTMGGGDMGWGMGWGIAMMVAMLLFLVLVIVGVIWLVRHLVRDGEASRPDRRAPESALHVLERRYAEGEIDIDEYRERRSVIEEATDHGALAPRR